MNLTFQAYDPADAEFLRTVWNDILEDGNAFPGDTPLGIDDFRSFLAAQSAVTCLLADGRVAGYYILHPNNIGRCGHVANASYAVVREYRGRGLAEPLVRNSIRQAGELGFRGLQFNAVVAGNAAAIHTYRKLGFSMIGTVPGGFRLKDGTYSDMHVMYLPLL